MLVEQSLEPESLALEITETAMLEQTPETFDILTRLRIKNIDLAIDDFGIGYSSLTQLFRMPFNEMKIDKSLVGRIIEVERGGDHGRRARVARAQAESHRVRGRRRERPTLEALGRFGCDYAQGYYISRPVPPAEIPKIIARWDKQQREPVQKLRSSTQPR